MDLKPQAFIRSFTHGTPGSAINHAPAKKKTPGDRASSSSTRHYLSIADAQPPTYHRPPHHQRPPCPLLGRPLWKAQTITRHPRLLGMSIRGAAPVALCALPRSLAARPPSASGVSSTTTTTARHLRARRRRRGRRKRAGPRSPLRRSPRSTAHRSPAAGKSPIPIGRAGGPRKAHGAKAMISTVSLVTPPPHPLIP